MLLHNLGCGFPALEDIADLLDKVDIGAVFHGDNTTTDLSTDPVIHFYEPFLAEYDAEIKKARYWDIMSNKMGGQTKFRPNSKLKFVDYVCGF
jgi:hypothetical protein